MQPDGPLPRRIVTQMSGGEEYDENHLPRQ
jgi:hypothetical protein